MQIKRFPQISREGLETLQINMGYKCNQACSHCHVNAGPNRTEMMDDHIISIIPKVIKIYGIKVLDMTGGAPELHPKFKQLVIEANKLDIKIIDRCNLTILTEPGQESLASFLAKNRVEVTASLPCYLEENVDKQRGRGVFERSIKGLKLLNSLGYGKEGSGLILNLVFNPIGPCLPPDQKRLEEDYRKELHNRYGISFSKLLALANMPINRFADYLKVIDKLNDYENLLKDNYNPNNLCAVMCKKSISIDWNGKIYDCDFNQQLKLNQIAGPINIQELIEKKFTFEGNPISVDNHCFGCTAGSGSSCGGALS